MTRKKILWIPQLATIDKVTSKTIINADSNITILNGMIENLNDSFEFCILMPPEESCNCSFKKAIPLADKIIELDTAPMSAFSLRYDFSFNSMVNYIKDFDPDIIVNNTSTLTKNLQAVIYSIKSKAKLINFMHFLDHPKENKVPKEVSYFVRQIEGIICADLAVFQSYTVESKATEAIMTYFNHEIFKKEHYFSEVWNATYSQKEIDQHPSSKGQKKRIIFPNRLSSTNYSNHLRFFEAISNISKERDDFEVIINNPTQSMSWKSIQELCPNLTILNDGKLLDKDQYFLLLNSSDIGVALFTQEGHGGVSSKQFQAAGCLPVFPKVNEYAFLMPEDYQGYCKRDLNDLEKALNYVLDICRTDKGKKLSEEGKRMVWERDSFESNSIKVKKSLDSLLKN